MRYIIIEDERLAYSTVKRLMETLRPEYRLVGWATGVEQGAMLLREVEADLLISDIRLDDGLCFEVFDTLTDVVPTIITTAYDEYAERVMEKERMPYLRKPITAEALNEALETLEAQLPQQRRVPIRQVSHAYYQGGRYRQRFLVKKGALQVSIEVKNIGAIYSEEKLTRMRTLDGERYTLRYTLSEVEEMLNPEQFQRLSRNTIANIRAIDGLSVEGSTMMVRFVKEMKMDSVVVSRNNMDNIKAWMDDTCN